jgi:hypothetical protein
VFRVALLAVVWVSSVTAFVASAAGITREQADVNEDGAVNALDLQVVATHFGRQTNARADVNGDGSVNSIDLGLVSTHAGPALRDKYRQPFSSQSPWNRAVGSGAVYAETGFGISTGGYTVVDEDVWVVASGSDPLVPV